MNGQGSRDEKRDFEAYQLLLNLWVQENPIKTNKLQALLLVNTLLITAVGFDKMDAGWKAYVYAAGVAFNVIWVLSIGRTALYQDLWQMKLRDLASHHTADPRFEILEVSEQKKHAHPFFRAVGGVSSRWYLVLTPFF